jgi:hypothetical protein
MKVFIMLAVAIFALIAVAHAYRLATGCEVVVNGTVLPMWGSWVGLVVAAGLAVMVWREARR